MIKDDSGLRVLEFGLQFEVTQLFRDMSDPRGGSWVVFGLGSGAWDLNVPGSSCKERKRCAAEFR